MITKYGKHKFRHTVISSLIDDKITIGQWNVHSLTVVSNILAYNSFEVMFSPSACLRSNYIYTGVVSQPLSFWNNFITIWPVFTIFSLSQSAIFNAFLHDGHWEIQLLNANIHKVMQWSAWFWVGLWFLFYCSDWVSQWNNFQNW